MAIFNMATIAYIVGVIDARGGNVFPLCYISYISNCTVHRTVEMANNYQFGLQNIMSCYNFEIRTTLSSASYNPEFLLCLQVAGVYKKAYQSLITNR